MRTIGLVFCAVLVASWSTASACQLPVIGAAIQQPEQPTAYDAVQVALAGHGTTNPAYSRDQCQACGDYSSCDYFQPVWFGGADMTGCYVDARPGGRITLSIDNATTIGTDLSLADAGGFQDQTFVPRFYLGRRIGEKWSIVARYWHLDAFDASIPDNAPGQVNQPHFMSIVETSAVELYNVDIEAMRSTCVGRWELDGTIGGRHSSFYSDQVLNSFGVFSTGNFVQLLQRHFSSFDGTGLTASVTARRPIGDTCCSLFVSARGSNAWGLSGALGSTSGTAASSPSSPLVGAATVTRFDADAQLAIGEFQLGLQWERRLKCVPANAFFRAAFEYQYWTLQMPPTGGTGFGGTIGDITINSFVAVNEGKAELYGLSLGAGFTW